MATHVTSLAQGQAQDNAADGQVSVWIVVSESGIGGGGCFWFYVYNLFLSLYIFP